MGEAATIPCVWKAQSLVRWRALLGERSASSQLVAVRSGSCRYVGQSPAVASSAAPSRATTAARLVATARARLCLLGPERERRGQGKSIAHYAPMLVSPLYGVHRAERSVHLTRSLVQANLIDLLGGDLQDDAHLVGTPKRIGLRTQVFAR